MESNPALLEKIRTLTGGNVYADDPQALRQAAQSGAIFRANPISQQSLQPLWYWLVVLAGLCLFLDVATRRIAIEPAAAWAGTVALWGKIRRQEAPETTTVFLERLQTRKAKVGESIEKQKAAKRFAPAEGAAPSHVAEAAQAGVKPAEPPKKPAPAKKLAEEKEADFATRLMRAKKKALEDRDKPK